MCFLEEMIEYTSRLLEEEQRREKVLKNILLVLKMVSKQKEYTKPLIKLMLEYEKRRQEELLEQKWLSHRISEEQKKEEERNIQLYEEYVMTIMNKKE